MISKYFVLVWRSSVVGVAGGQVAQGAEQEVGVEAAGRRDGDLVAVLAGQAHRVQSARVCQAKPKSAFPQGAHRAPLQPPSTAAQRTSDLNDYLMVWFSSRFQPST